MDWTWLFFESYCRGSKIGLPPLVLMMSQHLVFYLIGRLFVWSESETFSLLPLRLPKRFSTWSPNRSDWRYVLVFNRLPVAFTLPPLQLGKSFGFQCDVFWLLVKAVLAHVSDVSSPCLFHRCGWESHLASDVVILPISDWVSHPPVACL